MGYYFILIFYAHNDIFISMQRIRQKFIQLTVL